MASDMRPRVTRRERKLHLSYELPHRIHCSRIYPIAAPNGSTLLLYGYDGGLRILWRGGRRRRSAFSDPPKPNGAPQTEIMLVDDTDEEPGQEYAQDEFEEQEEELDPDCPYPSIIQHLDLQTGSDVLHVAVPSIRSSPSAPEFLQSVAAIAISSADGAIRLLQIPLIPPADDKKNHVVEEVERSQVELATSGPPPADLAIKYLPGDAQPAAVQEKQKENGQDRLLIAAASRVLSLWSVSITARTFVAEEKRLLRRLHLSSPAARLAFHPSIRSTQLMLADHRGFARIYDPYAFTVPHRRPGSSDSALEAPASVSEPGNWVTSYHTSYTVQQGALASSALSRRKKLLDAQWVMAGKGIIALLEDGHWGVWDVTGSTQTGKGVEEFAIRGFLGLTSSSDRPEPALPRKSAAKLAPMTPNTRKSKADQLFTGVAKIPGVAADGGITVTANSPRTGQTDESVVMWYDSELYSIVSMQSFWQRSIASGSGPGSLYAPGLIHINDISLDNEHITSVSHLAPRSSSAGIGQMNQRDLLISTEHRVIVLQTLRPSTPARTLFQVAERPLSRDQPVFNASNLELVDIDRSLADLASGNTISRKVGFAR